jgi:hypothetical protein
VVWLLVSATSSAVELRGDGVGDVRKLLELLIEVLRGSGSGVLLEPVLGLLDGVLDGLLVLILNLATETLVIVDLVLEAVGVILELVARLNALTVGLVLLGVLLGLLNHALNIFGAETTLVVGDGDGLGLTGTLIDGGNLEDTIGIKLKGDLNLGNTTGRGAGVMLAFVNLTQCVQRDLRNVGELELSEVVVVLCHCTFTLEDLDEDYGLVVGRGGEDLGLLGGNVGTTLDESCHNATSGLNTESERVDVHENDLIGGLVTSEDTTLNGGTESDSLVGVDILAGLLSEELLKHSLNLGDTSGTTDKDNVINVGLLELGVLENLLNRLESLLEKVVVELLELGAGEGLREVLALVERLDFDLGGLLRREGTLGLLDLALQFTHGLSVLGDVDVVLLVVFLDEVGDDPVVKVLTTEMSVTSGRLNLENTLLDSENGHIEGTATKIVDEDLLLSDLVETVSQSGSGGLVDNTENVETGDSSSVLCGGTLSVVEVGGDGDDSVLDGLAEIALSNLLHLAENHGGDLLGCESGLLLVDLDADAGLATLVDDLEGEVLDVVLDGLVGELLSNETFLPYSQYPGFKL